MSDKFKVFKEGGKIHQVTHWDLDYLSQDEVRDLYERKTGSYENDSTQKNEPEMHNQKLPLLLITMGLVLLAGSLCLAALI
jgi:hypothetical protein